MSQNIFTSTVVDSLYNKVVHPLLKKTLMTVFDIIVYFQVIILYKQNTRKNDRTRS